MYADNEIYFDVHGSGAFNHEGYVFMGGPGRAVFDRETYAFLRLEPLGGVHVSAQEQPPIVEETPAVQETMVEPAESPLQQSTGG